MLIIFKITLEMLGELIAKVKGDLSDVVDSSEKQMLVDHYRRTIDYIKKEAQNETSPFHGISL